MQAKIGEKCLIHSCVLLRLKQLNIFFEKMCIFKAKIEFWIHIQKHDLALEAVEFHDNNTVWRQSNLFFENKEIILFS